jgi:uncharacterized protein YegP (UPF0339 family)
MRTRTFSLVYGSLGAVALAGLLVACDNPDSRNPLRPSAPRVTGVELIGPSTIAPGQTVEYTARVRLSDGTQKSGAGASVRWNFDSQFIQITDAGIATAKERTGDTLIRVMAQGSNFTSSKEVTIVPEGTFRLSGRVVDADSPSVGIAGARVEAMPGSIVATTDANGQYRLYGVAANATILASGEGYLNAEQQLQLTEHGSQNFQLKSNGDRLSLNGNYRLEIDASNCLGSRPLPAAVRIRQYDAAVTTAGAEMTVVLTESRFKKNSIGKGDRFTGRVTGRRVTFTFSFLDYYYPYYGPSGYPDVVEQLSDSTLFVPSGSVIATGSTDQVSGIMSNGHFLSQWTSTYPIWPYTFLGSCSSSSSIRVTLSAR